MDWLSNKPVKSLSESQKIASQAGGKAAPALQKAFPAQSLGDQQPRGLLQEGELGSQALQLLLPRGQRHQHAEYLLCRATEKASQLIYFFFKLKNPNKPQQNY